MLKDLLNKAYSFSESSIRGKNLSIALGNLNKILSEFKAAKVGVDLTLTVYADNEIEFTKDLSRNLEKLLGKDIGKVESVELFADYHGGDDYEGAKEILKRMKNHRCSFSEDINNATMIISLDS